MDDLDSHSIRSLIDLDIRESAETLIREHGCHAFGYAIERAEDVRERGHVQISRQWAAVAFAVGQMAGDKLAMGGAN